MTKAAETLTCAWGPCGAGFTPNTSRQLYCCGAHTEAGRMDRQRARRALILAAVRGNDALCGRSGCSNRPKPHAVYCSDRCRGLGGKAAQMAAAGKTAEPGLTGCTHCRRYPVAVGRHHADWCQFHPEAMQAAGGAL